jgi:hypothetical protein
VEREWVVGSTLLQYLEGPVCFENCCSLVIVEGIFPELRLCFHAANGLAGWKATTSTLFLYIFQTVLHTRDDCKLWRLSIMCFFFFLILR